LELDRSAPISDMTRDWAPVGWKGRLARRRLVRSPSVWRAWPCWPALLGAAAQGQADLEDEQLVVDEAVAGPGRLLAVGGAVDGLQGGGPVGQAVGAAQRLGHEVGDVTEAVEQGPDDPAEPARGDLLAGRVDGDDLVGEPLGVVALAQHLVAGVGHAEAAAFQASLPEKAATVPTVSFWACQGWLNQVQTQAPLSSATRTSRMRRLRRGIFLARLRTVPTRVTSAPFLAWARSVSSPWSGSGAGSARSGRGRCGSRSLPRAPWPARRTPREPWPAGCRAGREVGSRPPAQYRCGLGRGRATLSRLSAIRANSHSRKVFRRWLPSVTSAASTRASG
jgi:hypothetical protein